MSPSLSVVTRNDQQTAKFDSVARRVQRLQAEARQLAGDHVAALTAVMSQAAEMAAEIAKGGSAYPAGVRDIARRFAQECDTQIPTIRALAGRTHRD